MEFHEDVVLSLLSGENIAETVERLKKEKQRELDKDVKMSVIVQKMIDADCSGVMFTSNPQGIMNECVITVGKGNFIIG